RRPYYAYCRIWSGIRNFHLRILWSEFFASCWQDPRITGHDVVIMVNSYLAAKNALSKILLLDLLNFQRIMVDFEVEIVCTVLLSVF
ncbi:MAG: hypothetical protein ACOC3Y_00605, partial [Desulfohalobiaceae bacterium]